MVSVFTADTYLGKEVLSIPAVGGWIRKAMDYKWIVIVVAGLLIIAGCIPRGKKPEKMKPAEKTAPQST